MPHFLLHLSPAVLQMRSPQELLREVHAFADHSGLFAYADIKVRIHSFEHFMVGGLPQQAGRLGDFVHVFAYIMEGRTAEEKKALSHAIVKRLKELLPGVPVISMNVMDFDKASYTNNSMV